MIRFFAGSSGTCVSGKGDSYVIVQFDGGGRAVASGVDVVTCSSSHIDRASPITSKPGPGLLESVIRLIS